MRGSSRPRRVRPDEFIARPRQARVCWQALVLFLAVFAGAASARTPNIVLIMADDLGWRDVGYHGSEIRTPRIDALAAEGVTLERFYVQPICSPTRAAVMTGKSPARLGIYQPIAKISRGGLPLEEEILPQFLARAGYQPLMAGKWHLGHAEKRYFPHARGFEQFYGHVTGGIGYWDHNHGGGHDWQRDGVTLREEGYATRLIADEAVRLLNVRDPARPTFLFASFNAPHLPNEAPPAAIEAYPEGMRAQRRIHAGMVSELDTAVGRILDAVDAEGMRGNTLVWFFSDNGGLNQSTSPPGLVAVLERLVSIFGTPLPTEMLEFVRENTFEGASDNAPLRGGKTTVYEGGVRVPSVLRWPGRLSPGVSQAFITAQDILPTLLQAAGRVPMIPDDLDGRGRWRAITNRKSAVPGTVPDLRVEGLGGVALLRPPWKLVVASAGPFSDPEYELYDVYADPGETTNLAAAHPDRVASLRAALDAWPLGESIHAPLWRIALDPDRFGGPEDREPWADVAR